MRRCPRTGCLKTGRSDRRGPRRRARRELPAGPGGAEGSLRRGYLDRQRRVGDGCPPATGARRPHRRTRLEPPAPAAARHGGADARRACRAGEAARTYGAQRRAAGRAVAARGLRFAGRTRARSGCRRHAAAGRAPGRRGLRAPARARALSRAQVSRQEAATPRGRRRLTCRAGRGWLCRPCSRTRCGIPARPGGCGVPSAWAGSATGRVPGRWPLRQARRT